MASLPRPGRLRKRPRPGRPEASGRRLPNGLLEPLGILDEGEPEIPLPGLAEAAARADGHVGLFQELHGEVDRAHPRLPRLGHCRPDEHAGAGRLDLPSDPPQAADHGVAPGLVLGDLGQPGLLAVPQGNDRGDLHRLEDPVVVIALDRLERGQHVAVASREADPPAGHVVALGHRRELAADALGPLHRQEARRLVAVEADVAVGEVVDHEEAVLLRQGDDLLEERLLHHGCRRVVRVVEHQDLGPGIQAFADPCDVGQKRVRLANVERDHVGRSQRNRVDMDRETGRGDERGVAGAEQGQAHVAEPFLRPDRGNDLVVGVEVDAEPGLVPLRDLLAQVVDPGGDAVPVVTRVVGGLAELLDDPLAGRVSGIPHPEVDHVDVLPAHPVFELVDLAEEVRRQVADPGCDLQVVPLGRLVLLGTGIEPAGLRHGRTVLASGEAASYQT